MLNTRSDITLTAIGNDTQMDDLHTRMVRVTEDLRAIQRELNCAAMQAPSDPELMEALSALPETEAIQVLCKSLDQMRHFLWFYTPGDEQRSRTRRQAAPVECVEDASKTARWIHLSSISSRGPMRRCCCAIWRTRKNASRTKRRQSCSATDLRGFPRIKTKLRPKLQPADILTRPRTNVSSLLPPDSKQQCWLRRRGRGVHVAGGRRLAPDSGSRRAPRPAGSSRRIGSRCARRGPW